MAKIRWTGEARHWLRDIYEYIAADNPVVAQKVVSEINMNKLLENNLEQIKNYCQDNDVERLYAFGSITSDSFTANSDVDLLVRFKNISFEKYTDNYFRLHKLFETIFKRKVDLVTENSLSNPYFIKKVNQTKALLYEG